MYNSIVQGLSLNRFTMLLLILKNISFKPNTEFEQKYQEL